MGAGSGKFKWRSGFLPSSCWVSWMGLGGVGSWCHCLNTQTPVHTHIAASITRDTVGLGSGLWCTKPPVPPLRPLQIYLTSNLRTHAYHANTASSSIHMPHLSSWDIFCLVLKMMGLCVGRFRGKGPCRKNPKEQIHLSSFL